MKKTLTPRRAVCGLLAALAAAAAVWLLCRWVGYDLISFLVSENTG